VGGTVNPERQVEPAVERSSFLLDRCHRPDGRAAEQDADLASFFRPVPEGPKNTGKPEGSADELGKLVEDEQQRLARADGCQRVEHVVPIAEWTALQISEISRNERRCEPGEDPEVIRGWACGPRVEDHLLLAGELLQERRLSDPPPPPDEPQCSGGTLPPVLERPQLTRSVDEVPHGNHSLT
jgi:hypothetical protein